MTPIGERYSARLYIYKKKNSKRLYIYTKSTTHFKKQDNMLCVLFTKSQKLYVMRFS